MKIASSLAASIKTVFNIESNLQEGHGGIFEIAIDGQRIYTNRSECSVFPDLKEIFQTIIDRGGVPVKDSSVSDTGTLSMEGLSCPLPSTSQSGQELQQACDCSSGNDALNSSGCCGPSECGESSYRSWSKTLVFSLVVLIALAAGGYSFYKRSTAKAQEQDRLLTGTTLEETTAPSTDSPSAKRKSSKATASSCVVSLDSIETLGAQAADKDALFLFLSGGNKGRTRSISRQVERVVNMLSGKGKRVAAFTLAKNTEGHEQLKEQFSVKSLPCVIVAGRGCGPVLLKGDEITENNLLLAFVQACMPTSSCASPCQ